MMKNAWNIFLRIAGHAIGIGVVAVALALTVVDAHAADMVAGALWSGQVAGTPWVWLSVHALLSVALWALVVFVVRRVMKSDDDRPVRVVKLQKGTALTEFLIILTPFLLLTSGLAQLAILNTASLLADVASYNATRAAWVWDTREDVSEGFVETKAQIAAAMALAPTAPSDFRTKRAPEVAELIKLLNGSNAGASGSHALHGDMTYLMAYDTGTFEERLATKLNYAFIATDMEVRINRDPIESNFTYQMNVVFPWFAYIWGSRGNVAGRTGYYIPLRRKHSLPQQLQTDD